MTMLARTQVCPRGVGRMWAPRPRISRHRSPLRIMSSSASTLTTAQKEELVGRLLAAKEKSGLSFDEIATQCGTTNAYMAQLFQNQAQLKEATAKRLKEVVPALTEEDISLMSRAPWRSYDPQLLQEPHVYRMNEAVMHYGRSIKSLINEKFGDGIMSAIDFYVRVDKVKGVAGEDRVVITMNGKFLPHLEQLSESDTSRAVTSD